MEKAKERERTKRKKKRKEKAKGGKKKKRVIRRRRNFHNFERINNYTTYPKVYRTQSFIESLFGSEISLYETYGKKKKKNTPV